MTMPQQTTPTYFRNPQSHHSSSSSSSLSLSLARSLASQNIMLDPRTDLENSHFHSFNTCRRIDEDLGTISFGSRARNTAQNYENFRIWNGGGSGVQFRADHMMEYEDKSAGGGGVVSSAPPLWRPQNNNYGRHLLSPNSRAQAIARGQWELMEMVKSMPESCYELSLKDLVEHPTRVVEETEQACLVDEKISGGNQEEKLIKRQESKKKNETKKAAKMMRISSIENGGLLLKMVLPFSLGLKKKKKSANNTGSRVSPKPEASDKSSISSSSSSSSSSRSNSCRKKGTGCFPGCRSFFSP